jgi:hypothetical protein
VVLGVVWTAPLTPIGGPTHGATTLAVQLDGGSAFFGTVPYVVLDGGAGSLTRSGDSWIAANVDLGPSDGTRVVVAGWRDGGPNASLSVTVDVTGPTLSVVLPTGFSEAKRDAVVPMLVESSESLLDAGVTFGGRLLQPTPGTCAPLSSAGVNRCFTLDFSQPPLLGLDGGFAVVLSGVDSLGNVTGGTDAGVVGVTRVRWTSSVTGYVQAMAVGSDGTLYLGTSTTSSTIHALSADSGVSLRDAGAAFGEVQSLAVGRYNNADVVFAAYNTTTANIGAVWGSDLTSLSGTCNGASGSKTYAGLALYQTSGLLPVAVGTTNAVGTSVAGRSRVWIYTPNGAALPIVATSQNDFDSAAVPTSLVTAANVVISKSTTSPTASFLRQDISGNVTAGAWWQPVTLAADGSGGTPGTALQIGNDPASLAFGQALVGTTPLLAAGLNASSRQLFWGQSPGLDGGTLATPTVDKGVPAIVSATEAYVGSGNALVRFSPSFLDAGTLSLALNNPVRTSPVLTAPSADGGLAQGYVVSRGGELLVFGLGTAGQQWTAQLPGNPTVLTHPTLDCNRARPGTGILYVGTQAGTVTAIIVDNPKLLDDAGVWPKYQRSAGNAGNDDLNNFPTNWPSCQ